MVWKEAAAGSVTNKPLYLTNRNIAVLVKSIDTDGEISQFRNGLAVGSQALSESSSFSELLQTLLPSFSVMICHNLTISSSMTIRYYLGSLEGLVSWQLYLQRIQTHVEILC